MSEAVQLVKSQPVEEEEAKVDAQGVQPSVAVRLIKSNSAKYNSSVSKTDKRLGGKSEVRFERTKRRRTPNSDGENPGDA